MWQLLALLFIFFGVFIVYSTNKNQNLFRKPLTKKWRTLGYLCWLLSLVSCLQTQVLAAALFTWFFVLLTTLACIPLLSLMITPNKNNGSNKGASS